MGALTRLRPMKDIMADLGKGESIAVISCNNCVRISGAGGEGVWEKVCEDLKQQGFNIEQEVLITNPCSRGYFENLKLVPGIKSVLLLACHGAQAGFKTIFPQVRLVSGTETMGLYVYSKKAGVVKLMMPTPGFEDLRGTEFTFGNTNAPLDDIVMDMEVQI